MKDGRSKGVKVGKWRERVREWARERMRERGRDEVRERRSKRESV